MKTKHVVVISLILLLAIVSIMIENAYNHAEKCKAELAQRFTYDKISMKDSYAADCGQEFKDGIQFPLEKPESAELHFHRFGKMPVSLNRQQTATILQVLNDTSSYVWGELGTPYFDSYFTFHDKDGNCIGYTDFSFEGQTYSTPSLAKMKWGLLNENAREKLLVAIGSEMK